MTFPEAIKNNFSKYATFSGRAPRSEFWWWALFVFLANIGLGIVDIALFGSTTTTGSSISGTTDFSPLSNIFSLATLLPSLAVTVRRLHDRDKTGWWWFLWLIPLVGWIILIVWLATEGTRGANRYGPDPLAGTYGDTEFGR